MVSFKNDLFSIECYQAYLDWDINLPEENKVIAPSIFLEEK